MRKTVQLDARRLVLVLLALDELETATETTLCTLSYLRDKPKDVDDFLEAVNLLEDCKEFKAEICYLISSGR